MSGGWVRTGEVTSLSDKRDVPCEVYEWTVPRRSGSLRIRFLSPRGERHRRFFCEEVFRAWEDPSRSSRFLDKACDCGFKLLRSMGPFTDVNAGAHKLFRALFRNRHLGHVAVTRRFTDWWDFFEFDSRLRQVIMLTPGIPTDNTQLRRAETPRGAAARQLREVDPGAKATPKGMIELVQRMVTARHDDSTKVLQIRDEAGASSFAADRAMALDILLFFGLKESSAGLRSIWKNVASALLDGPIAVDPERRIRSVNGTLSLDEDYAQQYEQYQREFTNFRRRLEKASGGKKDSDFDRWLKVESEHGFRRLLTRNSPLARDSAWQGVLTPRSMYRTILWLSYVQMARCYGALMRIALINLETDPCLNPTPHERELFRQMHLPQGYLGLLPLAFLGQAQLRWIVFPLVDLWTRADFSSGAYDNLTSLLGIYGTLVSNRREADRRQKEKKGKQTVDISGLLNEPRARDGSCEPATATHPLLTGTSRRYCGTQLTPEGVVDDSPAEWFLAEFYCQECDISERYRVSRLG